MAGAWSEEASKSPTIQFPAYFVPEKVGEFLDRGPAHAKF